jgi:hypothetical protein
MLGRLRVGAIAILAAGILGLPACRKAEFPGGASAPRALAGGPPRQNWHVLVRGTLDPQEIAVSEKQKHAVVWEDPDDPKAKIHVVFDLPPYTWRPFPNSECPDAEHARNPCRSGAISPLARGRKYTYHVFVTTAAGTKKLDGTILVDL